MNALKSLIKLLLNSKLFNTFGISLINFDLIKYTCHYKWIFKLNKIPNLPVVYNRKKEVADRDVDLCDRLIKAYNHATHNDELTVEDTTSKLWAVTVKNKYGKLISLLNEGNPKDLAVILSSMFRESFVYGIASGDLISHSKSIIGRKLWSMKYQDNVLALAEYLGVVRTESPQQGKSAEALKNGGIHSLVAKIEEAIGISINFPDIGAPYGIKANGSLITMEHPEHIYASLRMYQAAQLYLKSLPGNKLNIMEIGCGFGDLTYWTQKLNRLAIKSYTLIDLPIMNVIQGYFLAQAFDPLEVSLWGELASDQTIYFVYPTQAIDSTNDKIHLLINENSMPEMTNEIVENYLRFASKAVEGIFFSYNHEAYAPVFGTHQVCIPEIAVRVGGLTRVSRNISWVRNGYVEETYSINQS